MQKIKPFARNKLDNPILFIQTHACSIHPAFILIDKGQRIARIIEDRINHRVFHNQIGFEEKRILFNQAFLCQSQ